MPLIDPTMEEAKILLAGDFGSVFSKIATMYATVLYWSTEREAYGTNEKLRNGTTFFMDCGKGVFGVTAGHVYDVFVEHANTGGRCQIGQSQQLFDLRERLIARGKRVDIATFRIATTEISLTGATILTGWQREWPPKPPALDKGVIFAGFPGVERKMIGPREIEFGIYSGLGTATSVNDRDISCLIEHEYAVPTKDWALAPVGYDLAGMSGGPMLAVVQNEVMGWRLAGVIYECGRSLLEVVKAARADYIRDDGTIEE